MHSHDTGRYIQPYGYNIPTPNLMKLAKEGTLFRHAYCTAPTCSPSRAGLLTGMAPHSCGMLGLAHRGFCLDDYSKHLVHFLNSYGYETVLSGVQHEADESKEYLLGYGINCNSVDAGREFIDSKEKDLYYANCAAEYLLNKTSDKPFFMSFGMVNTHREFPAVDEEINPDYVIPPFPLYDTAGNREDMAGYITSAKYMDKCIGIVMDALRKSGKEEETMVIFTTDHGMAFPRMKCSLYDTGIGVSLIIRYPGNRMAGKAIDALVSQIDLFPTICDMVSIEQPEWLQGTSILPLMEGRVSRIRDEIFSEVNYHAAYEPLRCVRTERYKLIRFYDQHNKVLPSNIDDGLSKLFYIKNGYLNEYRHGEMMFDLYLDPVERTNLVFDNTLEDVYIDLNKRLDKWMKDTNDPLLYGKVKKPAGAIINEMSCISAKEKLYE